MNNTVLLQNLMDHLPDAIFFKDRRGRFVRVNRVLASWYGQKDPASVIGKSEADFYPPEFARAALEAERAILTTAAPILDQEEKFFGPDGKARWVSTTKVPLHNGKGTIVGMLGISRDIRSTKRAEERVRDSEALYQSLIESLPQCIFRKDVEGKYVYVNQRLCALLGQPSEKLLGKTDLDVNPPALAAKYRRDDQWVMTHQKTFVGVEDFKTKRKKIRIRVYKTPVYDSNGRVIGVQGVFTEI